MEILKYKNFEGSAELSLQKGVCWGKILYIDDVVTYESGSINELQKQFEDAVDDYIETCALVGKEPQKPCRGQFNVRVSPELHKAALRRAVTDDSSLNDVVCKALDAYLTHNFGAIPAVTHGATAGVLRTLDLAPNIIHPHKTKGHPADAYVNTGTALQDDITASVTSDYWMQPEGLAIPAKAHEKRHAH